MLLFLRLNIGVSTTFPSDLGTNVGFCLIPTLMLIKYF